MRLRPLNENLVIQPEEEVIDRTLPEEVRKALKDGKLILPDIYEGAIKKVSPFGKVISWGNRCHYEYKSGDRVWFGQFCFSKLYWEDRWLWIVNEHDLHAKVEE